ncbi:AraC family transcriptional regulator [candidate division KSB1 bacterium]|nr:AraC family transcriptional regulator [candidate division KSB1 bacterium]
MQQLQKLIRENSGLKHLKDVLALYHKLFKIPVFLISPNGEIQHSLSTTKSPPETVPDFPNICQSCRENSCQESFRWGDAYISQCTFGVCQISVPILYNDELIGGISSCPILMRKSSTEYLNNALQAKNINEPEKAGFLELIKSIPVTQEKNVKLASELLFSIAGYLSKPDAGFLLARRQLHQEQALVAEEVQRFKRSTHPSEHHLLPMLNLKKEQDLITRVRLGDKIGARKILNEFLGQVMLHNPMNIELLKAHVLELAIILTRAVVEKGANAENILGLRYQFVSELSDISDHDKLCFWVVKIMESICDNIYQTRNQNHFRILEKACHYIRENYSKKLTLESVAKKVYISPFYLCHLYKEELNTTFGEYLTRARIDASKRLLRDSSLTLAQIALEVGYPDQSYFTKVFKKIEKVTPRTFRRLSVQEL